MNGRRAELVSMILSDLEKLDEHYALKIDLDQMGETKANLRSALHREGSAKEADQSQYTLRRETLVRFSRPLIAFHGGPLPY